jgi:hypothetical protein
MAPEYEPNEPCFCFQLLWLLLLSQTPDKGIQFPELAGDLISTDSEPMASP